MNQSLTIKRNPKANNLSTLFGFITSVVILSSSSLAWSQHGSYNSPSSIQITRVTAIQVSLPELFGPFRDSGGSSSGRPNSGGSDSGEPDSGGKVTLFQVYGTVDQLEDLLQVYTLSSLVRSFQQTHAPPDMPQMANMVADSVDWHISMSYFEPGGNVVDENSGWGEYGPPGSEFNYAIGSLSNNKGVGEFAFNSHRIELTRQEDPTASENNLRPFSPLVLEEMRANINQRLSFTKEKVLQVIKDKREKYRRWGASFNDSATPILRKFSKARKVVMGDTSRFTFSLGLVVLFNNLYLWYDAMAGNPHITPLTMGIQYSITIANFFLFGFRQDVWGWLSHKISLGISLAISEVINSIPRVDYKMQTSAQKAWDYFLNIQITDSAINGRRINGPSGGGTGPPTILNIDPRSTKMVFTANFFLIWSLVALRVIPILIDSPDFFKDASFFKGMLGVEIILYSSFLMAFGNTLINPAAWELEAKWDAALNKIRSSISSKEGSSDTAILQFRILDTFNRVKAIIENVRYQAGDFLMNPARLLLFFPATLSIADFSATLSTHTWWWASTLTAIVVSNGAYWVLKDKIENLAGTTYSKGRLPIQNGLSILDSGKDKVKTTWIRIYNQGKIQLNLAVHRSIDGVMNGVDDLNDHVSKWVSLEKPSQLLNLFRYLNDRIFQPLFEPPQGSHFLEGAHGTTPSSTAKSIENIRSDRCTQILK